MADDKSSYRAMLPRTGKLVDSSGEVINQADWLIGSTKVSPGGSSRDGLDFRTFYHTLTLPTGDHFFVIDIPTGYNLVGMTRITTVVDGRINSTFQVASSFTVGTQTYSRIGHNFNEVLGSVSNSVLRKVDSITLVSETNDDGLRSPPVPIISAGASSKVEASSQTESGFQPTFSPTRMPAFKYNNPGVDLEFYLQLTFQEFTV